MITQERFNELTEENNIILTKEEEYEVFEFYNANKTIENRNRIALKNYRLIFKPAWDYTRFGSEYVDLQQEAFLALLKAVDKFDYTLGNKFSTYAYPWFESYLQKCTIDDRIIHIPFNVVWKIEKMRRLINEYEEKHDVQPPDIYLTKLMGIDYAELNLLKQYDTRITLSMDYEYGSDEGERTTFHNYIIDENQEMDRYVDIIAANTAVNDVIKKYTPRDKYELLARRYGLDGNKPCSLSELSEIYKVSPNRLNMKIKKILWQIRGNVKIRKQLEGII